MYRVRFVSCLATDAGEQWVTSPKLKKSELSAWVSSKAKELNKNPVETQPA